MRGLLKTDEAGAGLIMNSRGWGILNPVGSYHPYWRICEWVSAHRSRTAGESDQIQYEATSVPHHGIFLALGTPSSLNAWVWCHWSTQYGALSRKHQAGRCGIGESGGCSQEVACRTAREESGIILVGWESDSLLRAGGIAKFQLLAWWGCGHVLRAVEGRSVQQAEAQDS